MWGNGNDVLERPKLEKRCPKRPFHIDINEPVNWIGAVTGATVIRRGGGGRPR